MNASPAPDAVLPAAATHAASVTSTCAAISKFKIK
jgi:hypothetical protein